MSDAEINKSASFLVLEASGESRNSILISGKPVSKGGS
jgi:hypothetical protein